MRISRISSTCSLSTWLSWSMALQSCLEWTWWTSFSGHIPKWTEFSKRVYNLWSCLRNSLINSIWRSSGLTPLTPVRRNDLPFFVMMMYQQGLQGELESFGYHRWSMPINIYVCQFSESFLKYFKTTLIILSFFSESGVVGWIQWYHRNGIKNSCKKAQCNLRRTQNKGETFNSVFGARSKRLTWKFYFSQFPRRKKL